VLLCEQNLDTRLVLTFDVDDERDDNRIGHALRYPRPQSRLISSTNQSGRDLFSRVVLFMFRCEHTG